MSSNYGNFRNSNVNGAGHNVGPPPPRRHVQDRRPAPPPRSLRLKVARNTDPEYLFGNLCPISPFDFPSVEKNTYVLVNNKNVFSARLWHECDQGTFGISDRQRSWAVVGLNDTLDVRVYDPLTEGENTYLVSMDLELSFAGKNQTETPYDQDEMADFFKSNFQEQILAPTQRILMDRGNIIIEATVRTVQLGDMSMEKQSLSEPTSNPMSRGMLLQQTTINFFKDPKSKINIKPSSNRPAPSTGVSLDFKFEDMGIGGLDAEFNTVFRRAFASRVFPPSLIEKMGLQHVRGILLYGPPGTGKTLLARNIGAKLTKNKPYIINGPEVLNKYVGQSEENIRKAFAAAEEEQEARGNESNLHIIIFDELDAICKQRGSGAGGGTGVGDSVVNQLLSKIDGVKPLNNFVLIGMTNRKDMLDDALLRPGRLEVHVEISLPDNNGRQQIFSIHTSKMRENKLLGPDVDLVELAGITKNFSGAEIHGLVRAAQSYAFARHTKVGTIVGVSDDVDKLKVTRQDFINALQDVQPAYGVSEEELTERFRDGILPFSDTIQQILDEAEVYVRQIRNSTTTRVLSVLFHGPPGSGKTALAAKIAMTSDFPFIKIISPRDVIGFSEAMKIQHLIKVFDDAHKSPLNILIVDDVEKLIDWQPIGPRFQNSVLTTLSVLLDKEPPKGRRLLIFATTTQRSVLQQLDIFNSFSADITVPNVNDAKELGKVLKATEAFDDVGIHNALAQIRGHTGNSEIGVGVKRILSHVEGAKQDEDMVVRFVELMKHAIDARKYI